MRSQFLSELLRTFPQTENPDHRAKIVISCRTHHFESISEMDSFLLGLGRSGTEGLDYRVLNLLPFSHTQIQDLLRKQLGEDDAKKIFSFIQDDQYLAGLASRPFILQQLAKALPILKRRKEQGLSINTFGFYEALIEDNLNRDTDKHMLKPRHKKRLLIDLAATLWNKSGQVWNIDDLNDWFQDWLIRDDSLARQYQREDSNILEMDLRNSSLLIRFGEKEFGFSHSSMHEFFLSQWIIREWQQNIGFRLERTLSTLTQQFICDSLEFSNRDRRDLFFNGLGHTLARPYSPDSQIALTLLSQLAEKAVSLIIFETIDLAGAALFNSRMIGIRAKKIILRQADLNRSHWQDCNFEQLILENTNLNESTWLRCTWQDIQSDSAWTKFARNITLAESSLPAPNDDACTLNWHQYLPPNSLPTRPLIDSSLFSTADLRLHHSREINDCAFSPDGRSILSASSDQTLKIWDLNTGQVEFVLSGSLNQWWSIRFVSGRMKEIKGTELAWRMVNLAQKDKYYHLDDVSGFEYYPSR